ncbi:MULTISPECIES: exopolysaccharide biosynthesis polyprenyl glycosylphosphotransferase [Chloroflexus]|uniref:Undecaprenyl-phosphate galactose phosphotransferase n=1 Tax=Chloroflexus aggregans (strain MD-66 / DSM 9485) TaxID=326427 RepID=B8GCB4_CHLAD|nr:MULTISPECIES: exopolysaccharide biosynthesis polyprenyl glycosylphosphotransferase [Chloroflexus]ACL24958.1 Undecaprenyl-phosphate galactose phosphotransferase [Chloroflexus aggregans DSM 9485]GIV88782.1 MAG: multidrug MFS transporter [Chloroflexus sp.]
MRAIKPSQETLDPKSQRMLTIFAERRFQRTRANQRLRFTLSLWVIRTKLLARLKRVLDVSVATVAIILSAPIMVITAIAIKLESPGPVIFKQVRVGKDGEHFYCYKFRSMYVDAEQRLKELQAKNEADGPVFKMKRDPRVTRVGRVIRKLSIDELPQLFNVLKGEMSLVGPRPALPSEVAKYTYEQIGRLHAIPGITGLQQVSGRSDLDFKRWVELDLQYIAEQSIWKDIEILLRTIPAVLLGRGAY